MLSGERIRFHVKILTQFRTSSQSIRILSTLILNTPPRSVSILALFIEFHILSQISDEISEISKENILMSFHRNAWDGIRIAILAKQPLLATRLEQNIAANVPNTESSLSAFDNYDSIYHFCKDRKDVGLILIHENCGEASFASVFRELSNHYDNANLPCFGVILRDGEPNPFSERQISRSPNLIDYIDASKLIDDSHVLTTFDDLWTKYTNAFENIILPPSLQASFVALAEETLDSEAVSFHYRLTNNLCSDVNVSWLEMVSLKWAPVLSEVKRTTPALLKPHEALNQMIERCGNLECSPEILTNSITSKSPLCHRIYAISKYLDKSRRENRLQEALTDISKLSKPGAPKLVRHISKNAERILSFTETSSLQETGT